MYKTNRVGESTMANEKQKFLDAESTATQLVDTLSKLKNEIMSYNSATKNLDEVKNSLVKFIDEVHQISKKSLEILETLRSIGGLEILTRLKELNDKQNAYQESSKKQSVIYIILIIIVILLEIF